MRLQGAFSPIIGATQTLVSSSNFIVRSFAKEAQDASVVDSEYIKQLKKASPTGKLLDLLNTDSTATVSTSNSLREDSSEKELKDVIELILQSVDNVKPLMNVDGAKAGTKIVYTPVPLIPRKQTQLAIKWIIEATEKRCIATKKPIHECLATEILLAYQKKGAARLKRDELHKLAMDNRANISVKWW